MIQFSGFIGDLVVIVLMRFEKVIIRHPRSQVVVSVVDIVKAAGYAVRDFISTVGTFDHPFGEAVLVRREVRFTDFVFALFGFPVVTVKIGLRGSAAGADAVRWDITGVTSASSGLMVLP